LICHSHRKPLTSITVRNYLTHKCANLHSTMKKIFLGSTLLAAVFMLAACGSDGGDSSPAQSSPFTPLPASAESSDPQTSGTPNTPVAAEDDPATSTPDTEQNDTGNKTTLELIPIRALIRILRPIPIPTQALTRKLGPIQILGPIPIQ